MVSHQPATVFPHCAFRRTLPNSAFKKKTHPYSLTCIHTDVAE